MPTFHLNLFGRNLGGGGGTGDRTLTTQVYSQIVTDLYSSWVGVHSFSHYYRWPTIYFYF